MQPHGAILSCKIHVDYLDELLKLSSTLKMGSIAEPSKVPEPLCSKYDKPVKDTAIKLQITIGYYINVMGKHS